MAKRFDDLFEHLVTGGRADEYPALVDRFKARFDALTNNLDEVAAALEKKKTLSPPSLAPTVRSINKNEGRRLSKQLELQVLRQRLSITDAEGAEREDEKARVKDVEDELSTLGASIYDALEDIRAEVADLDEEE